MKKILILSCSLLALLAFSPISQADLIIPMHLTADEEEHGEHIGDVIVRDTDEGLLIIPDLENPILEPGLHGFHVHTKPSCANLGTAAEGHYDPKGTGKHLGPANDKGHLGDLPFLSVNAKHKAQQPLLAPELTKKEILGHALILHEGGDNFSDSPEKLGGGGNRIACGIITKKGSKAS
ncbi:MAG: superoxide dismutase family protein [Gammaproteobacteria bacterium]